MSSRRTFCPTGICHALVFSGIALWGAVWSGSAAIGQPPAEPDPPAEVTEQTIYIPYEKLQAVFEKEGRGVFLPYKKFDALWKAAQRHAGRKTPVKPPVAAVMRQVESAATVGSHTVDVTAKLEIDLLGKGWITVPLRLKHSAIESATIGGKPARILFDADQGYRLLHHKTQDRPETIELELKYRRAWTKAAGRRHVTFEPPQASIHRWIVTVAEKDIAIDIDPAIAVTREGGPTTSATSQLTALVGAAPAVRIAWTPKTQGAEGLTSFATVQSVQHVEVAPGVVRSSIQLDYDISRAPLDRLQIDLPTDYKVANVFDKNVKRWKVVPAAGRVRLEVELFEPVEGRQSIALELERFHADAKTSFDTRLPMVRALGVGRQQGLVLVRLETGLRAEITKRVGLTQIDRSELPPAHIKTPWEYTFRYASVPYELSLRVEQIQPRITVAMRTHALLTPQSLRVDWRGRFHVADAGVFRLRVDLPDGFDIRSVRAALAEKSNTGVAVQSYHREAEDSPAWVIQLTRKVLGDVVLDIELWKAIDDINLSTPTGKASSIPIPIPRPTADDVVLVQGGLIVQAPESLRVSPDRRVAIRPVSLPEAYRAGGESAPGGPRRGVTLSFAHGHGAPELTVKAERRKPLVTVRQVLTTQVEPGVVKYTATFLYSIRYSGIRTLRVDLPATIADRVRNTTRELRRVTITPPPDDVDDGDVAWSFSSNTELLGDVRLQLAWETKTEELEVGGQQPVELPRLVPRGVTRAQGQILLDKAEGIDIEPTGEPKGVRPIDPEQDVFAEARRGEIAMAFEFVGDWHMTLRARRYEPAPSKLTSIDRAVLRVVSLPNERWNVQAIFRLTSAEQRVAIQLPTGAEFDAQPLRIDGVAVAAERGEQSIIYVPLVDTSRDKPTVVELRYHVKGKPDKIVVPSFPEVPAVQKVFLVVYLPLRADIVSSGGPWTFEPARTSFFWEPMSVVSRPPRDLLQWVTERHRAAHRSAATFPVGRSHSFLYSTLRPLPSPDGDLQLRIVPRWLLIAASIGVVLIVGLIFLGRSIRLQVICLLVLGAAAVSTTAFWPELTFVLVHGGYGFAFVVLGLIWSAGHVWRIGRYSWRSKLPAQPVAATSSPEPSASGPAPSRAEPSPKKTDTTPQDDAPQEDTPHDARGDDEEGGRQ